MSDKDIFGPLADFEEEPSQNSQWLKAWEYISNSGFADLALRLGTHVLLLALILMVAWGLRRFYLLEQLTDLGSRSSEAFAASNPTQTPSNLHLNMPSFLSEQTYENGIPRIASFYTDIPSRPRLEVIEYTVESGDTLFGIAEKYGLKPETVLWANQQVLGDNPHNLRPEQVLNILPADGTYHRWSAGDGLNGVAKFFGVQPEDIINFPGNNLTPEFIGDFTNPNIDAGTWLVIPNGKRQFVSWSAPDIPRDNPSVAAVLGPGACESIVSGASGAGIFIWPANNHFLSGYDYVPDANHPGIDIDGNEGDPVYAADSGVVVYAGLNNWGYGNVIVINHGNGWQTLYAHLNAYYVSCGQSVIQGNVIGAIGSTGNADGSHLHFEMMYNGVRVNPHDYIQ